MKKTMQQRFEEKVDMLPGHGPAGECWNWTAGITRGGYGEMKVSRKMLKAHRISYLLANGELPDNLFILHRCDNRRCVNPAHLFTGTNLDNMLDMIAKGRHTCQKRTACPKGHPYTPSNTHTCKRGKRSCKECNRQKTYNAYHAKRIARCAL